MLALACFRVASDKLIGQVTRRYVSSSITQHRHRFQMISPRLPFCCRPTSPFVILRCHYATQNSTTRRLKLSEISQDEEKVDQPLKLRSNTAFHIGDGLNPKEWTLIYYNPQYEKSKNMILPMLIFGGVCALFLTFALILIYTDRDQMEFAKSDLLFLGWPLGIAVVAAALTKYRRRYVLRIYEEKATPKSASNPKRRYCIVGLNAVLRRRQFIYDHTETSDAGERHRAIAMFVGNFKAKGRPWHVKIDCFERPQDYFNVRLASDVGK